MKIEDLKEFLVQNEFIYSPITFNEKEALKENLLSSRNIPENIFNSMIYYKVKFSDITNLVAIKKVFLQNGFAYFPEIDIIFCIKCRLWKQFSGQLEWNNKILLTVMEEDRIQDILVNIPIFVSPNACSLTIEVNERNIDEIATHHYPLCMQTIHNVLQREHHLKYDCKMQYGIFLKWLGLSYQDAMEFWKNEFTQKIPVELYYRKYSYLFKHQYGTVGSRIQYSPYTCEKIQNNCPGPGQHHGCPFKHWSREVLVNKFHEDGLSSTAISEIVKFVEEEKYKEACTAYFCIVHKVVREELISSPNQYCKESIDIEKFK